MNTPKEEAERLVNEFRMILMNEDTDCGNEILCTLIAIKNAIMCVDEIIKSQPMNPYGYNNALGYYKEIKQEIEKL